MGGELVIAREQNKPTGIALSATDVYWANEAEGTIVRCPKTGCKTEIATVVSGQFGIKGIALHGFTLYWSTTTDVGVRATFKKCSLDHCGTVEDAEPAPESAVGAFGVAAGPAGVFLAAHVALRRCDLGGCADSGSHTIATADGIRGVALGSRVYFTTLGKKTVSSCPHTGCVSSADEQVLVGNLAHPLGIAVDTERAYWTQTESETAGAGGTIRSCPLSGCTLADARLHAEGESFGPYALAVDEDYLFYTDRANGQVVRIPKSSVRAPSCSPLFYAACEACRGGAIDCQGGCSCPNSGQ